MVLEETQKELIEGCRRGDPDSFHALFERHKDRVYTIALRYTNEPNAAQDIAQDTFLKLFAQIGSFRGDASFEAWLYRLVVNACFDHKRKTRRWLPMIEGFFDGLRAPGGTALDDLLKAEMSGIVRAAVDRLPSEQRMIVVLRYSQSLSYDEIAGVMGCSPGTVASRLNRAHKTLERRLGRRKNVD